MAAALLDPAAGLPPALQERLDEWHVNEPDSQFSQYGFLNAYLGIKFTAHRFVIKPQKRVRVELIDGMFSFTSILKTYSHDSHGR